MRLKKEQKKAKTEILKHPFNFIVGKAGSGKTLLAVQVALDKFFKRQCSELIDNFLQGVYLTRYGCRQWSGKWY